MVFGAILLAATVCSAGYVTYEHGGVSSQNHVQDTLGGYAYNYAISTPDAEVSHSVSAPSVHHVHSLVHHVPSVHLVHHIHKRQAWGAQPIGGYAPAPVNGIPVDTPEVAQARANHLAAHNRALGAPAAPVYQPAYAPAPQYNHAYPQHQANGVPAETPEVQQAKAAHFAAVAKAQGNGGYAPVAPAYNHYAQQPNGAPADTPEVQQAKAQHFAAVSQAQQAQPQQGHWGQRYVDDGSYNPAYDNEGQWNGQY